MGAAAALQQQQQQQAHQQHHQQQQTTVHQGGGGGAHSPNGNGDTEPPTQQHVDHPHGALSSPATSPYSQTNAQDMDDDVTMSQVRKKEEEEENGISIEKLIFICLYFF